MTAAAPPPTTTTEGRRFARVPRRAWALSGAEALAGAYLAALLIDGDVPLGLVVARVAIVAALTAVTILAGLGRLAPAGGPVLAGLLSVLLGSTALAAGLAAGVPSLALAGVSAGGIVGAAAAVAGLAVFATGGWALLRPMRRPLRLVGLPGVFVVAQFWLLPVFAGVLATHAPQPGFDAAPPQGAQRVAFLAGDGTTLVGWFTPSGNGATVVVLPGAGGTKADTRTHAEVLARHGYGVLAMDHRGSGESGGHPMLYGWGGERDLAAAVTYLGTRPDVNPSRIAALGLSMGGEVAISGAGSDPRIKAVVAEGATARTCADQTFLPAGIGGAIHHFDSCLGWSIAGLLTGAPEPSPLADELRAMSARPALLIAADTAEEHAATDAFKAAAPDTVELWQPEGASHTGALSAYPQEWERRVIDFLSRSV
jgi:fermentation-respiration switch protein FrsA (DUF1100 family)